MTPKRKKGKKIITFAVVIEEKVCVARVAAADTNRALWFDEERSSNQQWLPAGIANKLAE